jgi:hypothetical protein
MDGGKDHKSHVAFPDGVMVGNCPEGYDRRLVSLFYETIVATDLFKEKNGKFVFSNGDPTGLGYHGDFMEGWAPGVLQEAVDKCTSLSGNMEDCPVFTYNSNPGSCGLENPLPDEIASEDVQGPMEGLPNQIQVQSGPEPAKKPVKKPDLPQKGSTQSPETSPTVIAKIPTVPVSGVETPSSRPNDVGEDVPENKIAQRPSSTSLAATSEESRSTSPSSPAPALTPAPAETPVALEAGKTITTEYWTSGRQVHHVVVVLEEVVVTAEGVVVTKTLDAVTEIPHKKRQHKHHHRARAIGGRKFR